MAGVPCTGLYGPKLARVLLALADSQPTLVQVRTSKTLPNLAAIYDHKLDDIPYSDQLNILLLYIIGGMRPRV